MKVVLMPRRIAWIGLVYLFCCCAVILTGCADALLLHPSTDPIALERGERRSIAFGEGQLDIVIDSNAATEPRAYVLAMTGNAGRAEYEVQNVRDLFGTHAVEIWALNPPGYGRSSGRASLGDLVPSALATFDAIAASANGKPIFVYGNSMGGAVALAVAARRPCGGLIARNPPPLRPLILKRHGWWNLWLLAIPVALSIPSDLSAIDNARTATCRAIFPQANRDEIIPTSYQDAIFESYGGPKQKIAFAGGHNDSIRGEPRTAIRAAIDEWLTRSD